MAKPKFTGQLDPKYISYQILELLKDVTVDLFSAMSARLKRLKQAEMAEKIHFSIYIVALVIDMR